MSSNNKKLSASEQQKQIWQRLIDGQQQRTNHTSKADRPWPSYYEVLQDVRKTDYNEILTCPHDIHAVAKGRDKKICPLGTVCCAKLELFPNNANDTTTQPYTGLLSPGQTVEHCIVRLSSALEALEDGENRIFAKTVLGSRLVNAKIFPGVAIKMFRGNGIESGNMLFLGCKVGQESEDFFAHCVSTQVTSQMPLTLKPILQVFKRYSKQPLLLGTSNLCAYDTEGNSMNTDFNFPFCLTLRPRYSCQAEIQACPHHRTTGSFLDDLQKIPPGTVLYDLFASPDPLSVADGSKLQRIGQIVSTSEMIFSPPNDGLFFRHQNKDEDFKLKPEWKKQLDQTVLLKNGRKGSVASVAGWKLFEQQINEGGYVDFERERERERVNDN